MNGEDPPERPDYITNIINGLERYNPEAVGTLEGYLQEQCEQNYCDSNANRTLLKLYVSFFRTKASLFLAAFFLRFYSFVMSKKSQRFLLT